MHEMKTEDLDVDRFKEAFKRYKKKKADLSQAIDLSLPSLLDSQLLRQEEAVFTTKHEPTELGLITVDKWKIFHLTSTPGVVLIRNPFREGGQHYWVRRCLVDYPCLPNICNLDAHIKREGKGRVWVGSGGGEKEKELLYRLRWTTLGYHYDWNTKEYYEERKSPFPRDLAKLSSFILETAGFPRFNAEAAIVNYYHLDSTLSGHTDHSERDLSCPLLSISFGQSAVFLIGGETKSIEPQAIVLHSGDVIIMSGPSRLAYHGVPKIITPLPPTPPLASSSPVPSSLSRVSLLESIQSSREPVRLCILRGGTPCNMCIMSDTKEEANSELFVAVPPSAKRLKLDEDRDSDRDKTICQQWTKILDDWTDIEHYISTSRINVNIRQVNKQTTTTTTT